MHPGVLKTTGGFLTPHIHLETSCTNYRQADQHTNERLCTVQYITIEEGKWNVAKLNVLFFTCIDIHSSLPCPSEHSNLIRTWREVAAGTRSAATIPPSVWPLPQTARMIVVPCFDYSVSWSGSLVRSHDLLRGEPVQVPPRPQRALVGQGN